MNKFFKDYLNHVAVILLPFTLGSLTTFGGTIFPLWSFFILGGIVGWLTEMLIQRIIHSEGARFVSEG